MGISFIVNATWLNDSKTVEIDDEATYGCVANMEPSLVKVQVENGHERLYIPFKTPYPKPPLCMTRGLFLDEYTITTMTSDNGIYLWRYLHFEHVPWSATKQRFTTFCFGGMKMQSAVCATSGQCSDAAPIPYLGLPSLWTVINWDRDGDLPMGVSFMACTWNATDEKLIECEDQSYEGVANMDVGNVRLEDSGRVLKISFMRPYAKIPHCFVTENQVEKEYYVVRVRLAVENNALSLRRTSL